MKKIINDVKETMKIIPSWVLTVYVISIILMNLLANKSINLPFSWLALDCGMVVAWIIFLIMDVVVKRFGARHTITLSIIALAFSLMASCIFYIASFVPGTWGETFTFNGMNEVNIAIENTFKGNWFIIFGSAVALMTSSIVNSILNSFIGKKLKNKNFKTFAIRSYASTLTGQIVDNLVFSLIVSIKLFGWSLTQCITCSLTGALVEALCELVFIPLGYNIVEKWKNKNIGYDY